MQDSQEVLNDGISVTFLAPYLNSKAPAAKSHNDAFRGSAVKVQYDLASEINCPLARAESFRSFDSVGTLLRHSGTRGARPRAKTGYRPGYNRSRPAANLRQRHQQDAMQWFARSFAHMAQETGVIL